MDLASNSSFHDYYPPSPPLDPMTMRDYYIEGGDCVIRVEDTMFKVHRNMLMRDGSIFLDMFSLPQGSRSDSLSLQGSSDDNPVFLSGDTPKEFNALCWTLYALPDEISRASQKTTAADFVRLLRLVKIAHKYNFPSIVKWSVDVLVAQCSSNTLDYAATCSARDMGSLMDVAVRTERHDLRSIIEAKWIARVRYYDDEDDHYYLHCSDALDSAEKHDLRKFMGAVYYIAVKRMCFSAGPSPTSKSPAMDFSANTEYSDLQTQRLLSGFYSLALMTRRFSQKSEDFYSVGFCHSSELSRGWVICLERMSPDMIVHVLEKIAEVRNGINTSTMPEICADCHIRARRKLSDYDSHIRETMADHFLGPDLSEPAEAPGDGE